MVLIYVTIPTLCVTNTAWHRLSHDAFASDLTASTLCSDPTTLHDISADDLVYLYRHVMTELLDRHCPVVKVRRKAKPMTQWLDAECRAVRASTATTPLYEVPYRATASTLGS